LRFVDNESTSGFLGKRVATPQRRLRDQQSALVSSRPKVI